MLKALDTQATALEGIKFNDMLNESLLEAAQCNLKLSIFTLGTIIDKGIAGKQVQSNVNEDHPIQSTSTANLVEENFAKTKEIDSSTSSDCAQTCVINKSCKNKSKCRVSRKLIMKAKVRRNTNLKQIKKVAKQKPNKRIINHFQ